VAAPAASAQAQAAKAIPVPVKSWLDEKARECRAARGRFSAPGDWYLTGDFNGDRVADYVVTVGGLDCETPTGMGPFAFGSDGPGNDFLISGNGGYRRFEGFMGELGPQNLQRRGDRSVLVVERGAQDPNAATRAIWGWNGSRMALLELRNARGQLVDGEGRLVAASSAQQSSAAGGTARPQKQATPTPSSASLFELHVSLSDNAKRRMQKGGGDVEVEIVFEVEPTSKAPPEWSSRSEAGTMSAGLTHILPATGGTVAVALPPILQTRRAFIKAGSETVFVSVRTHGGRAGTETVLNCEPFLNGKRLADFPKQTRMVCD
jgi:hypothetical protein